jgi:hypothetical protein
MGVSPAVSSFFSLRITFLFSFQLNFEGKCLRTLNLLREEGAKKSLPNTPPGQNFGARANEATQNFTERVYISDLYQSRDLTSPDSSPGMKMTSPPPPLLTSTPLMS